MNMELIKKENRLCTCCMEEHEVKVVRVQEHSTFKKIDVDYLAEYYYCDLAEECYMDEAMINANDIRMKDAYRKKMGLLSSDDIIGIRKKYKITQSDLCILLGWGGKTVTRYESHQVQDKAHDSILKKLNQDPEWFLRLLSDAKELISPDTYKKYVDNATGLYESNQDKYLRKSIEAKYARYFNSKVYNGNTDLSLDKVVEVICYFANSSKVTNLYKVKLMKLLWYADCLAYKTRGYAITGLVYQALPMGAVPIGHDSIIDLKGISCDEIDMGDGTAYHFEASEDKDYTYLQEDEIKLIDIVISKLGKMSKDEIVSFMHNERAYKETASREIISFEYAEYLQI